MEDIRKTILSTNKITKRLMWLRAGLGAALALLSERGELSDTIQWAGRNNDVMAAQHLTRNGQLKDVYSGGRQSSALEEKIERALTQRDEFGNIMTPKERFRNLCYG